MSQIYCTDAYAIANIKNKGALYSKRKKEGEKKGWWLIAEYTTVYSAISHQ